MHARHCPICKERRSEYCNLKKEVAFSEQVTLYKEVRKVWGVRHVNNFLGPMQRGKPVQKLKGKSFNNQTVPGTCVIPVLRRQEDWSSRQVWATLTLSQPRGKKTQQNQKKQNTAREATASTAQ
jgi:hypothetical protein